jgi:hypothetical protein
LILIARFWHHHPGRAMGQVATHMWLPWSHLCRSDVFGAVTFDFQDDLNTALTTMSLFGVTFCDRFRSERWWLPGMVPFETALQVALGLVGHSAKRFWRRKPTKKSYLKNAGPCIDTWFSIDMT